jgi:hypothetical protein
MGVHDAIKTVNSTLRTMLATVVVVAAGYAGYIGYALYNEPQQQLAAKQQELEKALDELKARDAQLAELNTRLARLEVAMRLLKVRHRLARLTVLSQHQDIALGMPISQIEFVEINDAGEPIGPPKEFEIQGDLVYVDYLRVTFDDKYVEQSDLDRATAICLFQRIFGEHQQAAEGFLLDEVGSRPKAYAQDAPMSEFERNIWNDFWLIANDPERAAKLGIYAAHGSAVSMRVKPDAVYVLELRSTGDVTIRPEKPSPPVSPIPLGQSASSSKSSP